MAEERKSESETESKLDLRCPICYENFAEETLVLCGRCRAKFHYRCITIWVTKKDTCPMCKFELKIAPKEKAKLRCIVHGCSRLQGDNRGVCAEHSSVLSSSKFRLSVRT